MYYEGRGGQFFGWAGLEARLLIFLQADHLAGFEVSWAVSGQFVAK
jgi:hypothetical protein